MADLLRAKAKSESCSKTLLQLSQTTTSWIRNQDGLSSKRFEVLRVRHTDQSNTCGMALRRGMLGCCRNILARLEQNDGDEPLPHQNSVFLTATSSIAFSGDLLLVKLSSPRSKAASTRSSSSQQRGSNQTHRSISPHSSLPPSSKYRQQLQVPGADGADAPLGLFPPGAPGLDPKPRRGSRSSILASASEAAGHSDRESIRSASSSSRLGPSASRHAAPRSRSSSFADDVERSGSPVSFYSTSEAPIISPRQSRQPSAPLDAVQIPSSTRTRNSFSSAADNHLDQRSSRPSDQSTSPRSQRRPSSSATSPLLSSQPRRQNIHAQDRLHGQSPPSPSGPSTFSPSRSSRPPPPDWSSDHSLDQHTRANLERSKVQRLVGQLEAKTSEKDGAKNHDHLDPPSTSTLSASSSANTIATFLPPTAGPSRARSKSTTTMPQPKLADRRANSKHDLRIAPADATSFQPGAPSETDKRLNSVPSKVSLRSRLFGMKASRGSSPSSSSLDSAKDVPSPKSAVFPPSIYSQGSQSDLNHPDRSESERGSERGAPSPSVDIASAHREDFDRDEHGFLDGANSEGLGTRKSSNTSSFLRRTIRFKDKSVFVKSRPSGSSMTQDSPALPRSPADSPLSPDSKEDFAKVYQYKQVNGRRGHHYAETNLDSQLVEEPCRSPVQSGLLPSVTESELASRSTQSLNELKAERPTMSRSNSGHRFVSKTELEKRRSTSSINSNGSSVVTASSRPYIPRSSSLKGQIINSQSRSSSPDGSGTPSATVASSYATLTTRRPRSGSSSTFSPSIQPRTTSSPVHGPVRRPVAGQANLSPAATPNQRLKSSSSRPKTADSGHHGYSSSFSSIRDILAVAHAISEEGAVYSSPDSASTSRFREDTAGTPARRTPGAPGDSPKPGLPPKNPLRNKRPSVAEQGSPSAGSVLPVNIGRSSFPQKVPNERPLSSRSRDGLHASPSSNTPIATRSPSGLPRIGTSFTFDANDQVIASGLSFSAPAPLLAPSALSPGVTRSHTMSRDSSDIGSRHERASSAGNSSSTELLASAGPASGTPSLSSESSSNTRKKKETPGAGSKILSFARELSQRDNEAEGTGTFRTGRTSKSKKVDAPRPVIRRIYDNNLEYGASHPTIGQLSPTSGSTPGELNFTNGVSPGTSVTDLVGSSAQINLSAGLQTPGLESRTASVSLAHQSPSLSGISREAVSPSITTSTPNLMQYRLGSLGRSPSFARQAWSIPQENLSDEQRRLVKRWFILRELLDTERSYASDLAVARDVYLARAKSKAGITSPLSPLSSRSASMFSQLASPDVTLNAKADLQPHLQRELSYASGSGTIKATNPQLPSRALFRHASTEVHPHALNSPGSSSQAQSSISFNSSNPSNRSSVYTVSSQSSQTSDPNHFPFGSHAFSGNHLSPGPIHVSTDSQIASPVGINKAPLISPGPHATSPMSSGLTTPIGSTLSTSISGYTASGDSFDVVSSSDTALGASDVRIIFAQLEVCAALADEMVAVLEDAVGQRCIGSADEANELLSAGLVKESDESDRIGRAFLRLMPRIEQVYTAYCSRHEASMTKLHELSSGQPKVAAFLKECTLIARQYTNAWDLASLLIKPVQRVLKYPLLLSEITSATTDEHPDATDLRAACVEIQKVADNINEVKKRKDLVEQIVSGKITKRTTSQRLQHGATKKLLRRQEKVRKLVLGPSDDILADGGQYKAALVLFKQLEKGVSSFSRRCTTWSNSVKESHLAQLKMLEQWRRTYALSDEVTELEAEARLRAFMTLIEQVLINEHWKQMDSEIRSCLTPAIHRIAFMFIHPRSVITKRDDREQDYTRFRAEASRPGAKLSDKKTAESAAAFIALHSQLMDEIPQFNYGVQTLLDICIESFSRTQATYHMRVHRTLIDFWDKNGGARAGEIALDEETDERSMRHLTPVKIFWPIHSSVAGFVESLGIISGTESGRPMSSSFEHAASASLSPASTTHFSPLQRNRELGDPDFTSNLPSTQSMSNKVEAVTAASPDELNIAYASSVSPFATPPLGTQGTGGSRSPAFSQSDRLLGSPAHITPPLQTSSATANKPGRSGGFMGRLRSVGSSTTVGGTLSRKTSQSADTMHSAASGLTESDPPTPISKDTPLTSNDDTSESQFNHSLSSDDAPMLPALSFNPDLFAQPGSGFMDGHHGLGVSSSGGISPHAREIVKAGKDATERPPAEAMRTMAAVANSPSTRSSATKNGHPMLDYVVGDLFRVADVDEAHLFGTSEHGETGWVERENFAPLT